MVELDLQKETLVLDEDLHQSSLREERQRTGRYIAVGTAIFLSLLGLYQAVARGTPQYAALFAPALIMFIYILWILNASANQRKALLAAAAAATSRCEEQMVEIEMDCPKAHAKTHASHASHVTHMTHINSYSNMAANVPDDTIDDDVSNLPDASNDTRMYSRSYSIA